MDYGQPLFWEPLRWTTGKGNWVWEGVQATPSPYPARPGNLHMDYRQGKLGLGRGTGNLFPHSLVLRSLDSSNLQNFLIEFRKEYGQLLFWKL